MSSLASQARKDKLMKKVKFIFYPIYLLSIIFVIAISFDITGTLEYMMEIGVYKYFSDLPFLGRNLLLFLSAMMTVEFLINNYQIFRLKRSKA